MMFQFNVHRFADYLVIGMIFTTICVCRGHDLLPVDSFEIRSADAKNRNEDYNPKMVFRIEKLVSDYDHLIKSLFTLVLIFVSIVSTLVSIRCMKRLDKQGRAETRNPDLIYCQLNSYNQLYSRLL